MSIVRILAIETSCDDTSVAIVEAEQKRGEKTPRFKVLQSIVSSQTDIHRHWGGVVPTLAKREHEKNLPLIWRRMSDDRSPSSVTRPPSLVNLVAVTVGPGLEPALWAGIEFAKKLSKELKIPLVGANHLEGHLYSNLLPLDGRRPKTESVIRHPSSVISRPNFSCYRSSSLRRPHYVSSHEVPPLVESFGETRDDAVGEAFDKVARLMGLPYPGGPEIEKMAREGNPEAIKFPRPMINAKDYDFSFSGLKTAVLYYLRSSIKDRRPTNGVRVYDPASPSSDLGHPTSVVPDVASSFQAAAIDVLSAKTKRAALEFGAKSIFLCGGVAANRTLRDSLKKMSGDIGAEFFAPATAYNTDNAAMIAAAAYMRAKSSKKKYPLEADSNLSL